jgi:hypothetical protein
MRSLNQSVILHAFDFDVCRYPETPDNFRLSEMNLSVNHCILDGVLLSCLACHHLQSTQEARGILKVGLFGYWKKHVKQLACNTHSHSEELLWILTISFASHGFWRRETK